MLPMSAYSPSHQWSQSEKIELLVNVLQSVVPDLPTYLLELVLRQPDAPKWLDMALPKGRSMHACQIAFEEMRRGLPHQPGPYRTLPTTTSYVSIAPAIPAKRSFSEQDSGLSAQQRPLQPRLAARVSDSPNPSVTNGDSPIFMRTAGPDSINDLPKKRGRPTKAEAERRDQALALEGKVHQPKKRPTKKPRPSIEPSSLETKFEEAQEPLLSTPSSRQLPQREQSSSGKRRSRRQTMEGSPTEPPGAGAGIPEGDTMGAESPSDRLLATRRDRGSAASSMSRPTQQDPEAMDATRSGDEITSA